VSWVVNTKGSVIHGLKHGFDRDLFGFGLHPCLHIEPASQHSVVERDALFLELRMAFAYRGLGNVVLSS
jgi:hypothetical protein